MGFLFFFSPNSVSKLQALPLPRPGNGFQPAGMHQPLRGKVSPAPGHQQQRALCRDLRWLPCDYIPAPGRRHLPGAHPHHLPAANRRGSLRALRGGLGRTPCCSTFASRGGREAGGSSWETCSPSHCPTRATLRPKILLHLLFPMDTPMQFLPLGETMDILSSATVCREQFKEAGKETQDANWECSW